MFKLTLYKRGLIPSWVGSFLFDKKSMVGTIMHKTKRKAKEMPNHTQRARPKKKERGLVPHGRKLCHPHPFSCHVHPNCDI